MTPIEERERNFRNKVNLLIAFPYELRKEFIEYWTEPDRAPNPKMRFEKEKTWDLSRRLHRWANNGFGSKTGGSATQNKAQQIVLKSPIKEVAELDNLLQIYAKHPTSIRFVEFGKWYEYLKVNRLMKVFTRGEVEELKTVYESDNEKCRCACVQITFNDYVKGGITFNHIMEIRQKLVP